MPAQIGSVNSRRVFTRCTYSLTDEVRRDA
jgi:hypothetical protein